MSIFHDNAIVGASGQAGYNLTRSLRFRSSAGAYLSRTPASTTNQKTFTISMWVKRGNSGSSISLVSCRSGASPLFQYQFYSDNTLSVEGSSAQLRTTQVFRDFSAWYHLVLAIDTTQATSSDRIKMYVNGVQVTSFGTATYPTQNTNFNYNVNSATSIGSLQPFDTQYFDGYIAEVHSIDGQALTPSSFGQTSSTTGVWQPKKYAGTYGTNGFYLPFTDNSALTSGSNAGLGKDFSGNGNYWNTNNISITSGSTYDSMTDVPTLTSATASNFPTWNPIDKGTVTVSNGNLSAVSGADVAAIRATFGLPQSGKWYWETTVSGLGYVTALGIADNNVSVSNFNSSTTASRAFQFGSWFNTYNSGVVQYSTNQGMTGGSNWSGASQLATNDVLMIAVDMDNGSMWVGKNGTWFNSSGTANPATNTDPRWTSLTGTTWFPYYASYGTNSPPTVNINFGQRPFAYTPPTGFVALNTFNLPTPTIGATASSQANKYFDALLYTGANPNAAQTVTGLNFQPDFLWIKSRVTGYGHALQDAVRGATSRLQSNTTGAESTSSTYVTSFNSNGFSLGTDYGQNAPNEPYVAWAWDANGSGSSNTAGSITSTVSANTTSGFSVVTYTGNGSAGATVGHGLGVAPKMVIVKRRDSTSDWAVYHASIGNTAILRLNTTASTDANIAWWNNTSPTSTVVTLGSNSGLNGGTQVMYCFAEVAGYSKFGSYTGNGSSDGTFVALPFRPKFIMVKRTDSTGYWTMLDSSRSTFNVIDDALYANASNAESTPAQNVDFLSNGFKFRSTDSDTNSNGGTHVYMAFAENPFKYSLAR